MVAHNGGILKVFWKKFKQSAAKELAYRVMEKTDPKILEQVDAIFKERFPEARDLWHNMSQDEKTAIYHVFSVSLAKESQRESRELSSITNIKEVNEYVGENVQTAYFSGYYFAKGYLTFEQMTELNLKLGDSTANSVRTHCKGAKSRGMAFSSAFAAIVVMGQSKAVSDKANNIV